MSSYAFEEERLTVVCIALTVDRHKLCQVAVYIKPYSDYEQRLEILAVFYFFACKYMQVYFESSNFFKCEVFENAKLMLKFSLLHARVFACSSTTCFCVP